MAVLSDSLQADDTLAFSHWIYPDKLPICLTAIAGVPITDETLDGDTFVLWHTVAISTSNGKPIDAAEPKPPTVCDTGVNAANAICVAALVAPVIIPLMDPAPAGDIPPKKDVTIFDKLGDALPTGIFTPVDAP